MLFEADSVAHWLARTRHGNNSSVLADAAASAAPADFDIANADHLARIDALLTAHALSDEGVQAVAASGLEAFAERHDPADAFLAAELVSAPPAWVPWAQQLADAAYSASEASRHLERRHIATRTADASHGPLATTADELLVELVDSLAVQHPRSLSVVGTGAALAARLASSFAGDVNVPDAVGARAIRRRLVLEGIAHPLAPAAAPTSPHLTVVRLPDGPSGTVAHMLGTLNDLALQLRDSDACVVLAPATALANRVSRDDELLRSDVLRTGRVRAMVRLPAGLVTSAPREALVLWVLGSEPGDAAVPDRVIAVADLSDAVLTRATRADLVSDVVALLSGARDARRHAFRFGRLVRTSSVLANRGALDLRGRPAHASASPRELPALLDQAHAALADDAPGRAPIVAPSPVPPAATIAELVDASALAVLPGVRVAAEESASSGLVVVGADDLDEPQTIGMRFVDPLEFAQRHPSARVTEPGDVVFRTSPSARAWVDVDGSKVVAYPARVLRIRSAERSGLVPELIVLDVADAPAGPGAWRRWRLRRVAPESARPLRSALADLAAHRAAFEARAAALGHYAELLTSAVAAGVVTLPAPIDVTPASESDH